MLEFALVLALAQPAASACGVSDEAEFATTKERPVAVGGGAMYVAARERRYLDVLRGPAGEPVQYKRLGSMPGSDTRTILDRYEVTYPGLEKPLSLYLDAYHYDDALKAPKGLTCAAPIALNPPGPDGFLAAEASAELAVARANRDVAPISLDTDGSSTHGVIFDRFRLTAQSARTPGGAAASDPASRMPRPGSVVVAYPLRCGNDKPPVPPAAVDLVATEGAAPKRVGELATGDALARLLPGVTLPPGSAASAYPLERPRPSDTIRIGYPESACGAATEATFAMKYANAKAVTTPMPALPAGQPPTDRPIYLQAIVDVDGSVQQVVYIGGPAPLAAAAIDAVRAWKIEPASLNGSPMVAAVMFQVRFVAR